MRLFTKHLALIARLVLVFTFGASSGLTTVVHICCMSKLDCCEQSPCEGHVTCDLPGVPLSGPTIRSDFACHLNAIVGGITIKSGEVEKDKKSELSRIVIGTITPSLSRCFGNTSGSSESLFSLAAPPVPPSVEKCVLNASLLI